MSYNQSQHNQSFNVVGVQFLCFRVTLVIASRSPFGIFAFGATNDELQFRARKGHTVSEARERAHSRFRGSIFLCFWVTLGIASRSPFGIFAIGGATDELQVRARSDRCTRGLIFWRWGGERETKPRLSSSRTPWSMVSPPSRRGGVAHLQMSLHQFQVSASMEVCSFLKVNYNFFMTSTPPPFLEGL